jgi:hypothetical protein
MRRSFAAPFVLVIAGCGSKSPPGVENGVVVETRNPPASVANPPAPVPTVEECRALSNGTECPSHLVGKRCSVETNDECGIQGYECVEATPGKLTWQAYVSTCNPPPPGPGPE